MLYEKISKLTIGAKMHTLTSEETIDYIITIFENLPQQARYSVTFDNGSEFTKHLELKELFEMQTYFCDPYASWQKGGVENTNGILRRRVPKGAREAEYTAKDIQTYIHRMNSTPENHWVIKRPTNLSCKISQMK